MGSHSVTCRPAEVTFQPPRPTQPPTYAAWTGNEYRPKCGDAVWLGSKSQAWLIPYEDERVWGGTGKTV